MFTEACLSHIVGALCKLTHTHTHPTHCKHLKLSIALLKVNKSVIIGCELLVLGSFHFHHHNLDLSLFFNYVCVCMHTFTHTVLIET